MTACRWIVGILFIFSGLIKINDPIGLSFKMQEFFEIWGVSFLNPLTLGLSIVMNTLEVTLGAALLLGFKMKWVARLLLAMISFFTFLTAYAMFSGKFKTCGCLGDCLPLTPGASFAKDLVLLVMIGYIFLRHSEIQRIFASNKFNNRGLLVVIALCILAQDGVLNYLPVIDCLPYKVGNNIVEKMQKPKGYVADSLTIVYRYKKAGKEVEFDQNSIPEDLDSTFEFIDRKDKLVRKGTGEAPISDFTMTTLSGNDTSKALFALPKYVMAMGNAFPNNFDHWAQELKASAEACKAKGIPMFYATSQSDQEIQQIEATGVIVLRCDATLVKTAARVNTTYFLMRNATIADKMSDRNHRRILKAIHDL